MKRLPALLCLLPTSVLAATNFDIRSIVTFGLKLLVIAMIFGALLFLVRKAPFIPADVKTWIEYALYFLLVVAIILYLLTFL